MKELKQSNSGAENVNLLLNIKYLSVIQTLEMDTTISQRRLAKKTGISLGLINTILKRLIDIGYVKASHLSKKTRYTLTPKAHLAIKAKVYSSAVSTIRNYQYIRKEIQSQVLSLITQGYRDFIIQNDGVIGDMVEVVIRESHVDGAAVRRDISTPHHEGSIFLSFGNEPIPQDFQGKTATLRMEGCQQQL